MMPSRMAKEGTTRKSQQTNMPSRAYLRDDCATPSGVGSLPTLFKWTAANRQMYQASREKNGVVGQPGCGSKPCTLGEHQNRWQMDVHPPQNGIAIGCAPWPYENQPLDQRPRGKSPHGARKIPDVLKSPHSVLQSMLGHRPLSSN